MSFTDKSEGELNMESKLNSGQEFIDLIGQRRSFARLEEPAPDKELLDSVFLSSLRVPDHMHLRPWRFLVIGGDDRNHLGDLFVKDCLLKDPGADIEACESARKKSTACATNSGWNCQLHRASKSARDRTITGYRMCAQ
jgi:nitroreductase